MFGDKSTGAYLLKLSWTLIRRHVLVKGTSSPDNSTLRGYWTERERRKLDEGLLPPRLTGLARAQLERCSHCDLSSSTEKHSTATTCAPKPTAEQINAPT